MFNYLELNQDWFTENKIFKANMQAILWHIATNTAEHLLLPSHNVLPSENGPSTKQIQSYWSTKILHYYLTDSGTTFSPLQMFLVLNELIWDTQSNSNEK